MSAARFPAYLKLIGSAAGRRSEAIEPAERFAAEELDAETGVVRRDVLLDRLETMGHLAPRAPLSFLVVKVAGLSQCGADDPMPAVARGVLALMRGTDVVGRLTGTSFGIALQGTGLTAAGAVAARLTHHLNRLPELPSSICITVSAATGTGVNAETLPIAAMDSMGCCG
jgi:GGDEF domain-containing protein